MKNTVILFASILVIISCKSTQKSSTEPSKPLISSVTQAQVDIAAKRWANTNMNELEEGEKIYKTRCNSCHGNYPIADFSEKKWLHEIDDMSPKADLTAEEKLKLTKHILSFRELNAKQ
jgi:cytochrome c5